MNQRFTSVPFKTESGLSQINGYAKFSRAGIVLEFESKLFGIIRHGVKEVQIPIAEILDLKFKKGVFRRGSKIELRVKTFAKLTELPYSDGKLILKLDRADFERGENAVEELKRNMSDDPDFLSPARTPVSELFDDAADDYKDNH